MQHKLPSEYTATDSVKLPTGTINADTTKGRTLPSIADFASRYNDKRHFLIASKLIGKYIPARPCEIEKAQRELSEQLFPIDHKHFFMGFSESCSGFGQGVFEEAIKQHPRLKGQSGYLHTTRQFKNSKEPISIAFKEEHSHAVDQVVMTPKSKEMRDVYYNAKTIVLVEDEITTGKTIENFLEMYIGGVNNKIVRVVILSILDIRSQSDKIRLITRFPNIQIITHSLCDANVNFYKESENDMFLPKNTNPQKDISICARGGRLGVTEAEDSQNIIDACHLIYKELGKNHSITIVGTSEFTHWPRLVASQLEQDGIDVNMLSTTRAPLKVGNSIKSKLAFDDHYGDGIEHYLYNIDLTRMLVFVYENKEQMNMHKELLKSLNALAICME